MSPGECLPTREIGVIGTRGFPGVQGGVEKHCEELYKRVVAAGVGVMVFTRSPYTRGRAKWSEWGGVRCRRVWTPRRKHLEALWHSFASLLIAWTNGIKVAHFHAIGPGLLVPLARLLGFRVVFTHHGFDYQRQKWGIAGRCVLRLGEWCAVRWADEVLAVSREIQRSLTARFDKRVRFAPNGVSIAEVPGEAAPQRAGIEPGQYAIAVARLVPEKGWDVLFRALSTATRVRALVGVGGADHGSAYAKALLASPPANAMMLGACSHDEVLSLVARARVFVLPSFHEGLPIALLEALALGTPVVASNIVPHREIIDHRVNGFLFRTGDSDHLAEVLDEVWAIDADELAGIVARGRASVARDYSWDRTFRATMDACRSLGVVGGCDPVQGSDEDRGDVTHRDPGDGRQNE